MAQRREELVGVGRNIGQVKIAKLGYVFFTLLKTNNLCSSRTPYLPFPKINLVLTKNDYFICVFGRKLVKLIAWE